MQLLIRILSIMYLPYAIAAFVGIILFFKPIRDSQKRKVILCILAGVLFALTWRLAIGIGSKRYAALFIFFPIIVLGYLSRHGKGRAKNMIRGALCILLAYAAYHNFIMHNQYSTYTTSATYTIRKDHKNNPLSSCSLVSFLNKGVRVIYRTGLQGRCLDEKISTFPFSNLRLNLNLWKYATDYTYFLFTLPAHQPPPTPEDLLLAPDQWKPIHSSFVDNHKKKRAYIFKYRPPQNESDSFQFFSEVKNGSFEDVVKTTFFAYRLEPMNPDFYRTPPKKLYPAEWDIQQNRFADGAKPEISIVTPGLSGDYAFRLSTNKSIYVYNPHAIDLRQDVYLSLEARAAQKSLLHIILITAGNKDQVYGHLYKEIAQIPFDHPSSSDDIRKFYFRLEPYNDGKNGWASIAFALDYGEVILDSIQLERKTGAQE